MQQLSGGQRVLVVVPFSCFAFFFFFFYCFSSAPFYPPLPPLSIVFQLHLLLLQPSSYRPLSISTHKSNFGLEFASKLDKRTDVVVVAELTTVVSAASCFLEAGRKYSRSQNEGKEMKIVYKFIAF